ncbi:hypothetical protein EV368DRAFT_29947 [Lentinula lateritia]|uniref:Uncharacterized protein n=1 Tax=Lentinula aff. lateritia TaxID=2804960 RepID=A0ACC1TTE5_9AGAR|nr:hypothetical protein F5876DRAFT_79146 [Lentinula aff. lateritia]KAJ3857589.1 hypothetical protein EV368DRAFT_29947 [Lentinula lateritia]
MHQALLIDEILEVIFGFCTESRTLSRVGRTCQAWKDPALDRVWWRLASFKPLLDLIPGLLCVNGVYVSAGACSIQHTYNYQLLELSSHPDFRRLHHYASRVKQIIHRQRIQVHPTLLTLILQDCELASCFRRLAIARLSLTNCHALCPIISSAKGMQTVELDLGFSTVSFKTVNGVASDFISTVNRVSTCFTSLSLRGTASGQVMNTVGHLSRLEALHLRVGTSLPAETLAAISTFPCLRELEIHTSHIQPEDFRFSSSVCFPSLETLDIRGRTNSIEKLLQSMQSDSLAVLRIDIEFLVSTDDTWDGLFTAIKEKTHASLLQLTIEHHMDTQDLPLEDDTPSSSDTTPTSNSYINNLLRTNPNALLNFEHLYSLSNHRELRQIVLETTPPILVRDHDLEHIVRWWPKLKYLDLGSVPTFDPRWTPKPTPAGLAVLSLGLSALETLVIPVNIAGLTSDVAKKFAKNSDSSLRCITLTALTPPEQSLAQCLNRLFPSIIEIHGTLGHEEHWDSVQNHYRLLQAS